MKETEIIKLLESFYNGTIDERGEIELLQYFESEPENDKFADDRRIFMTLYKEPSISVPDDLEYKLEAMIDSIEKRKNGKKIVSHMSWKAITSIAATIIIIIGCGLYILKQTPPGKPEPSPQEAYQETEKALILISQKLNKGTEKIEMAQTEITKLNYILNAHSKTN